MKKQSRRSWFSNRSPLRWALLSLAFFLLAVWSIWPAPSYRSPVLPSGSSGVGTVPMFNAWTIWWNADRLAHGMQGYWDAPIFYPEAGTFAFSDPQPATCCVAPLVWLTGTPIPAYYAYLLASLTLNALFSVRLLRTLRTPWWPAMVGGIAVLLLPLVHQRGDVLQLVPLWGVLWTIEALVKLRRKPTLGRGLILGLAYVAVFMTSVHHGLFWSLLLALTAWLMVPLTKWQRWLRAMGVALLVASVCLAPLLMPMRRILQRHHFNRQSSTVRVLSANLHHWAAAPAQAITREGPFVTRRPLSPGWLRVVALFPGLGLLVVNRRQRQLLLFFTALGLWAFWWSFGMNLHIGSWQPWVTLAAWVPGFAQVRSAYRFAYFVQLVVVLLAAFNLGALLVACRRRSRNRVFLVSMWSFVIVTGWFIAFEVPPPDVHVVAVPDVAHRRPWCDYLQQHSQEGSAIVCLPFVTGDSVAAHEISTRWMLWGIEHQQPMLNGYSGFFPQSWHRMSHQLHREPFAPSTLSALAELGVQFVVIDTRWMQAQPPRGEGTWRLVRVFQNRGVVEIWRITPGDI